MLVLVLVVMLDCSAISLSGPRQEVLQAGRIGCQTNWRIHEKAFPTGSWRKQREGLFPRSLEAEGSKEKVCSPDHLKLKGAEVCSPDHLKLKQAKRRFVPQITWSWRKQREGLFSRSLELWSWRKQREGLFPRSLEAEGSREKVCSPTHLGPVMNHETLTKQSVNWTEQTVLNIGVCECSRTHFITWNKGGKD